MVSRTIEIVEENGIVPAVDSVRFNPACAEEILVATHSNLRCIRDQTPFVVLGGFWILSSWANQRTVLTTSEPKEIDIALGPESIVTDSEVSALIFDA